MPHPQPMEEPLYESALDTHKTVFADFELTARDDPAGTLEALDAYEQRVLSGEAADETQPPHPVEILLDSGADQYMRITEDPEVAALYAEWQQVNWSSSAPADADRAARLRWRAARVRQHLSSIAIAQQVTGQRKAA